MYNPFTKLSKVFVKCQKAVSLASSIIKQNVELTERSKFAVKLLFQIAPGSASISCCLLKSVAIIL